MTVYDGAGKRGRKMTAPIGVADVITQVSEPLTIDAGHPLRGARCPLCGRAAGGARVVLATIIDMRHAACQCGAVAEVCFIVHAHHDTTDRGGLAATALGQFAAHHGGAVRP